MRNGRRHNFPRRVQAKVGRGVVIDIEPVRCDIGSITASENGKVGHRELLHVQMRGDFRMVLFLGPKSFYTWNTHLKIIRLCGAERIKESSNGD